jgi:Zn-dependent protease with chaperone function
MNIFDLLFLLAVLLSLVTIATASVLVLRGRRAQALKILGVYAICALTYLLAGVAVSYFTAQRVIPAGQPWCFDDWCLTVESVEKIPASRQIYCRVGLRIFSRARRVNQRALGAWIYLIDDRGRRYSPDADQAAAPLDVQLQPNESVATSRIFRVPNDARSLGLITGHGGPYCGPMSLLVIGESGCLFKKPTMIKIQ